MLCDKRETERQRQGKGRRRGERERTEVGVVKLRQPQRTANIWMRWWHRAEVTGEGTVWTKVGGERDVQGHTRRMVQLGASCACQSQLAVVAGLLVGVRLGPIFEESIELFLLILGSGFLMQLLPFGSPVFVSKGLAGRAKNRQKVQDREELPSPVHWYLTSLSFFSSWWWSWASRARADMPSGPRRDRSPREVSARWMTAALPSLEGNKILVLCFVLVWFFVLGKCPVVSDIYFLFLFFLSEGRNTVTLIFALSDERTKLRALRFSIFFAKWTFHEW